MKPAMEHGANVMPSGFHDGLLDCLKAAKIKPALEAQSLLAFGLFLDISRHFPNFVLADFRFLLKRLSSEGENFVLDDLPRLGKYLERVLITGCQFDLCEFNLSIKHPWVSKAKTRLPKFCNQLFSTLFTDDGDHRFHIDINNKHLERDNAYWAVAYLRQLTSMWSKVEIALESNSGKEKAEKALSSWISRSQVRWDFNSSLIDSDIFREARRLIRYVLSYKCPELDELLKFCEEPWGRHGPGAVSGGETKGDKWAFKKWPGLPSPLFKWNNVLSCESEDVEKMEDARVCLVPKDFRGPRIICIEPKENQFAQQGLMDILYRLTNACALSRRSIDFLSVEASRSLCYDYNYATIDLKDASDLISLDLARLLLPRWFFKLVTRFRTRYVKVNDLAVKTRCLATMGNATCFPLETLVFWALSLGTIIKVRDSFHPKIRKHLNLDVRVFGDDIVVPLWACDAVVETLVSSGLVINTDKTCAFSLVRESCGEWVWDHKGIKVAKFRSLDVKDCRTWLQWRDQLNDLRADLFPALYHVAHLRLVRWENLVRKTNKKAFKRRFNHRYQRMEACLPTYVEIGEQRAVDGVPGLYAWSTKNSTAFKHAFRKGSPKNSSIIRAVFRWMPEELYPCPLLTPGNESLDEFWTRLML